jgi:hypothetical protein
VARSGMIERSGQNGAAKKKGGSQARGDDPGLRKLYNDTEHGVDFALTVVLQFSPAMAALAHSTQGANFIGLGLDHCLL